MCFSVEGSLDDKFSSFKERIVQSNSFLLVLSVGKFYESVSKGSSISLSWDGGVDDFDSLEKFIELFFINRERNVGDVDIGLGWFARDIRFSVIVSIVIVVSVVVISSVVIISVVIVASIVVISWSVGGDADGDKTPVDFRLVEGFESFVLFFRI